MHEDQTGKTITAFRTAESALLARFGVAASERHVPIPDLTRARILDAGGSAPILWVHGGGAFGALWAPMAGALPGRRHILVDRPGFVLTDWVDVEHTDFRRHAVDFLVGVLDGLGLSSVDVVGNSMGGLWSLWLALDRPERVRSLTLVGAPAMVGGGSAPLPMRLLGKPGLGRLMMALEPPSPKQVAVLWRRMGHDPEQLDPTILRAMLAAERVPGYGPAWRALMRRVLTLGGPRRDVALADAELARIRCPLQYLWGRGDPFGGPVLGRRVAGLTPGARLAEFGTGHLPWLDDPIGCASATATLLAPLRGSTSPTGRPESAQA